ncbi:MAG TPA: LiaF domain-containing protein [Longimicrobiales bacterium]
MTDPRPSGQLVAVKLKRDQTIAALCEHFAKDRLTMEDFERRLDVATRSESVPELESLLSDLAPATPAAAPVVASAPAPPAHLRAEQTLIAIMGGVERRGMWSPAQKTTVIAFMGGAVLDFRDVQLPAGETEVNIIAFMGGAEVIVPPGMNVDVGGVAFMGGFSHSQHRAPGAQAGAPLLKIDGFAMMGGVDVQVRNAGESVADARDRLRTERHRLRQERRRLK